MTKPKKPDYFANVPRFPDGGFVGGIADIMRVPPAIIMTDYPMSRTAATKLQIEESMRRLKPHRDAVNQAIKTVITVQLDSFLKRIHLRPHTGDMQTMVDDIDRQEITPHSKSREIHEKVNHLIGQKVKQALDEMALKAIRGGR